MPDKTRPDLSALVSHIEQLRCRKPAPFYIAIDGRSGSGKSTLARQLQTTIGVDKAAIIEGDSFYSGGSANLWDSRSPAQNAACAIDWKSIESLLAMLQTTGSATWQAFDWHSPQWDQDTPPVEAQRRSVRTRELVIVEGVYTARAELSRYYDLRILLDVPPDVCHQRSRVRDAVDYCPDWRRRWSSAESVYFTCSVSAKHFDLVLSLAATTHASLKQSHLW